MDENWCNTVIRNKTLALYSQLSLLIEKCDNYNNQNIRQVHTISQSALNMLNEAKLLIENSTNDFQYENVLEVIIDQISLMTQKKKKYSVSAILCAYLIYLYSSSGYEVLRNKQILILPHKKILQRLMSYQDVNVQTDKSNLSYLAKVTCNLSEIEKIVILQVDEIHTAAQVNYKGSTLTGFAENKDQIAKTTVAFLVSSCFGRMKEIVNLVPTHNPNGKDLVGYELKATADLRSLGLTVLATVTDDNRINQNFYSTLAPNGTYFYDNMQLLYDYIHIVKNVRNNWLNKKDFDKTFFYPDFDDYTKIRAARFKDLRDLHKEEFSNARMIKKAYKLKNQSLYPTTFERQRVPLVLNILHDSTVSALRENPFIDQCEGTADFLDLWSKWFAIMNNKSTDRGILERNIYAIPIKSADDFQVKFLENFAIWLRDWRCKDEAGVGLTIDTFEAAISATEGMVKLIKKSFAEFQIDFFLPGKFGTNDLEKRFGKYRRLCGCNYLVSYKDVLEAEKKLRIRRIISQYPEELITEKYTNNKQANVNINDYVGVLESDFLEKFENFDRGSFLYVCGYAAHSASKNMKCSCCKDLLVNYKGAYSGLEYFDHLQRGGLIIPTENLYYILLHMNAIFEGILRTDNIKRMFQNSQYQQQILIKLTYLSFSNDNEFVVNFEEQCICEKSYSKIFLPVMKVFANVLLNNFRKSVNDKIEVDKREKKIQKR